MFWQQGAIFREFINNKQQIFTMKGGRLAPEIHVGLTIICCL